MNRFSNSLSRKLRSRPMAAAFGAGLLCAVWLAKGAMRQSFAAEEPAAKPKAKGAAGKKAAPQITPLEQQPYRVQVSVAFSGSTELLPAARNRIMAELQSAVERSYGRMFRAEYATNHWISPPTRLGLERVHPPQLLERYPGARRVNVGRFDKVFLLTVAADGPRFEICGREWDAHSQQLNPVESTETYQLCEVGQKAFSLIPRMFRPVLHVDTVKPRYVEMRLQAAVFPPIDPALAQLRDTDVTVPYFRYADKKDVVTRIQYLPWTYVGLDSISGAFSLGSVISPYFSNPLGSGRKRNVQILASRVRPRMASSRLKMVYQTDETVPLIGYNVQLVAKRGFRDQPSKSPVTQFSGRDGYVHIPVDPEEPVIWVYVYSGNALLARVPYVPGITSDETIPLPDDSIRLGVEGEIDLLRGRLIDTVARRATLMALAKMADENEKLPILRRQAMIDEKIRELYRLPGKADFHTDLAAIREPALLQVRRLRNKFAERRIQKLCDDTGKLIDVYLDMGPVQKFRSELQHGKL